MSTTTKSRLGIMDVVGLGLSIFFLWLTFRNFSFDWRAFVWDFPTILFMVTSMLLTVLPTYLNVLRFRMFFVRNHEMYARVKPFASFFIAHFYNAVLPGNVGEAVKIYHISKKYGINHRDTLSFWVSEKFMDSLMLPFLFIWPLFLLDNAYVRTILLSLTGVIVLALVYTAASHKFRQVRKMPFKFIPVRKARHYLYSIYVRFDSVIHFFWKSRLIFIFMGICLLFYALVLLQNYTAMRAAGVPLQFLSLDSLMLLSVIAIIARFIPSAPSAVGVLHYGIYSSLMLLAQHSGVLVDDALNDKFVLAAVLFHFIFFFSECTVGAYFVFRERKWLFRKNNT